MKRLCVLVPDVASAHRVVDDLRRRGTADSNIYVIAREGTEFGDLPDAGQIAASDFYPQLERGLAGDRGRMYRAARADRAQKTEVR